MANNSRKIFNGRLINLNPSRRNSFLRFSFSAHIPKARYFEQLECTTPTKDIPRGLPDIKRFELQMSRLGVSNSDHVVLYDRSQTGFYASSRAWWLLKVRIIHNDLIFRIGRILLDRHWEWIVYLFSMEDFING